MDNPALCSLLAKRQRSIEQALALKGHRYVAQSQRTARSNRKLLERSRRLAYPLGAVTAAYDDMASTLVETDESTASATFLITTPRKDRHGDVVRPEGCLATLDDYRTNPRVFFSHKSADLPIGSARAPGSDELLFWLDGDQVFSTVHFHQKTQESSDVCALVMAKELQAASIGFLPIHGEWLPDGDQPDDHNEINFEQGGIEFDSWSLLEWSVVSVPANPDAVRSRLTSSKSMSPLVRKELEAAVGNPRRRAFLFTGAGTLDALVNAKAQDETIPPSDSTEVEHDTPDLTQDDEPSIQALLFWPERFPTEADVLAWLDNKQLKTDNVFPGEVEGDPWVSIQFNAQQCAADTDVKEEIETGVVAVYCNRLREADDDELPPDYILPPDERNMKTPARKAKSDVPMVDDEKPNDTTKPAETPAEPEVPHGCAFLKEVHGRFCELAEHVSKKMSVLDNPKVAKYAGKLSDSLTKHKEELCAFGKATYPDHFKEEAEDVAPEDEDKPEEEEELEDSEKPVVPDPDEDEEEEDEDASMHGDDEDEEDDKPKKPKVAGSRNAPVAVTKINKRDLSVVKEAAEFLEEMAGEDNLKRSQRTASAHHAEAIKGVHAKYTGTPADDASGESDKAAQEMLAKLTALEAKFADAVYAATGVEIDG